MNQGHFSEICLTLFQAETRFRIEIWTRQYRQIVQNCDLRLMEIILKAPHLSEKSTIQNVSDLTLVCCWSEMNLIIELQTRQYRQNAQNSGAELLKQVLVHKYAQEVHPQRSSSYSAAWGSTPPSSSHSGGVTPPSNAAAPGYFCLGGVHPRANVAPARGGTPPLGSIPYILLSFMPACPVDFWYG